jgi:hypothetical protein
VRFVTRGEAGAVAHVDIGRETELAVDRLGFFGKKRYRFEGFQRDQFYGAQAYYL